MPTGCGLSYTAIIPMARTEIHRISKNNFLNFRQPDTVASDVLLPARSDNKIKDSHEEISFSQL